MPNIRHENSEELREKKSLSFYFSKSDDDRGGLVE